MKTRLLNLSEYKSLEGVELDTNELQTLKRLAGSKLGISPSGKRNRFDLTATSWVGALDVGSCRIVIRPKIEIDQVLFLISYAVDPRMFDERSFSFGREETVLEAVVPGFAAHTRRALARGVLQGYRTEEDALHTIRGRLRFGDQIRQRFGIFPPAEVTFDEFTEDIEENRLLRAAIARLSKLRIRSGVLRSALRECQQVLQRVTLVDYHPFQLPDIQFTRLNEHYRPAVVLAKLILQSAAFELRHGRVLSTSFLVDMNQVFENFVAIALREALELTPVSFPQAGRDPTPVRLFLDANRKVRLKPDISWWEGSRCCFVGDVKYKRTGTAGENPDLYQLLAYATATDLPTGLLIYAKGEGEPLVHHVVQAGKRLEIAILDLATPREVVLAQIDAIADRIRGMRRTALRMQRVA